MLTKPRKQCQYPGCKNKTDGVYCDEHKVNRPVEQKTGGTWKPRYDWRWRTYSQKYLKRNPICIVCGGGAEVVDHVHPCASQEDPLFWEPYNHQALCKRCHNIKTNTIDRQQVRGGR